MLHDALRRKLGSLAGCASRVAGCASIASGADAGYTLLTPPVAAQTLIHAHADPDEPGRVYRPELAVCARPGPLTIQLAALAGNPLAATPRVKAARAIYDAWQQPQETPGALRMENVIAHLNEVLGDDAVLTNGAGNYSAWLHRYYRYRGWRTQLAPTSGSMGYGLPAAIAAKLERPDSEAICLAGDGCFQMVSQEFGTACAEGANVIVLVCDNGMYGTIRMHQQRHYPLPLRPSGTDLKNPDFAVLARAYGAFGTTVTSDAEFAPALAAARDAGTPAILHLKLDPRALSPRLELEDA